MAISLLVSNLNGRGKNSFTACMNAHKTRETAKYGKKLFVSTFQYAQHDSAKNRTKEFTWEGICSVNGYVL